MNITKSSVPMRLPWGTPEVTGKRSEAMSSITTLCDLSFSGSRKTNLLAGQIHHTISELFNKDSMINSVKTLAKSRYKISVCLFLSVTGVRTEVV